MTTDPNKDSVLFAGLPEAKAKLFAWIVVGLVFYLLPLIFITFRDLRISNDAIGPWLPEGTEERAVYDDFTTLFENHDSIILSWEGAAREDPLFDTLLREIIKADRMRSYQTGEKLFIGSVVTFDAFIESFGEPHLSDPDFRKRVSQSVAGYLVSKDEATGLLILECTRHGANNRVTTFEMVDRVVRDVLPDDVEPRYAGPCFISICVNEESRKAIVLITPISALITLMVAFLFLRSVTLSLLAFGISSMAAAISISAIHFSGMSLGDMVAVVPSLAQLLAMSNVIHLINYYMEALQKHDDKARAWRIAISDGWLPTVAASITTVIGFSALFTSRIEVARQFALFGIIGVLIVTIIVLSFTPAVLVLLKPDVKEHHPLQERLVSWLHRFTGRGKWGITFSLMAVFGFAVFGLSRLQPDARIGALFPEESTYQVHESWFQSRMGSPMGSDLLLTFQDTVDLEGQFGLIEQITEGIRGLDPGYSVFSPSIFHELLRGESIDTIREKTEDSRLAVLTDEGTRQWRIAIRHPLDPDRSKSVFRARVMGLIDEVITGSELPDSRKPKIHLTGINQLFASSQEDLVNQLLVSFLCAFFIITPVIMIFLRSVSLGLIAIFGNLFPLVVFFGIMGWLGSRIDITTMMIAAVAFGIAVDDTVHFMTWLSRGMKKYHHLDEAIRFSFEHCAGAIIQTTLIISLGLGAFLLSDFQPTLRFAVFSGMVLIIAMIGDLVLVPALCRGVFRKWFIKMPSSPR